MAGKQKECDTAEPKLGSAMVNSTAPEESVATYVPSTSHEKGHEDPFKPSPYSSVMVNA